MQLMFIKYYPPSDLANGNGMWVGGHELMSTDRQTLQNPVKRGT